ncbi:hypothetical protein D0Z07_0365 [Hyphodiscus hymeniophilus]|uniref:Uncharacterized protein n=1 Tax=Hyphodiscus hymeniophilus TaxID=353542 RepID=A0A9P6VSD9_9HELO|nr:hypothetical protein D0Z07_0365 [Hyphodiscus hymeniophilus]
MPLSTTYLLPAILLNPPFIMHLINTFVSHIIPPSTAVISHSPHPFMESLGPAPGTTPYLDVHADNALCWRYTAVMVVVQVLAFGRVSENRVQRRARKAATLDRERSRREHVERVREAVDRKSSARAMIGGLDGAADSIDENDDYHPRPSGHEIMNGKPKTNGKAQAKLDLSGKSIQKEGLDAESETSLTETSDEEMMI